MMSKEVLLRALLFMMVSAYTLQLPAQVRQNNPPIAFEPNFGQAPSQVLFVSHGIGSNIFLTNNEAVVTFPPFIEKGGKRLDNVLRMRWVRSSSAPEVRGQLSASGVINYLRAANKESWITGVPRFSRVVYRDLYPGVDLAYSVRQRKVEYDVIVHPGADPSLVSLEFRGATGLRLDRDGNLIIETPSAKVVDRYPVAYQNSPRGKVFVDVDYQILSPNSVGFHLGSYDRSRVLIIDPVLSYSTLFGGSGSESVSSVALDSSGSAYLTGNTSSSDFPLKNPLQASGQNIAFVSKLASNGSGLIYSTYLGGETAEGTAIAVDRFGQAYVTGQGSPDFPGNLIGPAGGQVAFVSKLNAAGNALVYSLKFSGSGNATSNSLAIDSDGQAYVTGWTDSNDFPTTSGVFQSQFQGDPFDAYVVKVNASGTGFRFATHFGAGRTVGNGIAIDGSRNVYIVGSTWAGIQTTPNSFMPVAPGKSLGCGICVVFSGFVTKLNPTGSSLVYSSYLGGNADDSGNAISVRDGYAYVVGSTLSTNFPTTSGTLQRSKRAGLDAFVTDFNRTGSGVVYSTYLGGNGDDVAFSVAVNDLGHAHVVGRTQSSNFPVKNALQSTYYTNGDAFISKLWATGGGFHYSTYFGGGRSDTANVVRLDGSGNAYVAGGTTSPHFRTTTGAYQRVLKGVVDGFVLKLKP